MSDSESSEARLSSSLTSDRTLLGQFAEITDQMTHFFLGRRYEITGADYSGCA